MAKLSSDRYQGDRGPFGRGLRAERDENRKEATERVFKRDSDIERLTSRIFLGYANARDLCRIKKFTPKLTPP